MDIDALKQLQKKVFETWKLLHLDETQKRIVELEKETAIAGFWNNQKHAKKITQELNDLQKEYNTWQVFRTEVHDTIEFAVMAAKEHDPILQQDIEKKIIEFQKRFQELEFYILLSGPYDANNAIVSIHAGAGGVDAQDWAQMLQRMLLRFCEQRGWYVTVYDLSRGGEAGIKSTTFHVQGRHAYGYLQSENGIHRLVRISPFDAEKMRHTSFASVEVIPDLGDMLDVDIKDEDVRIDVFRSGGHGGQSVNTTDSAVRIVHLSTGITVTCQNEKSQHQNKASAMSILKSKLAKKYADERDAEERKLRGEHTSAEWGNQIRSYVLHPYKMVKDHRTNYEVG